MRRAALLSGLFCVVFLQTAISRPIPPAPRSRTLRAPAQSAARRRDRPALLLLNAGTGRQRILHVRPLENLGGAGKGPGYAWRFERLGLLVRSGPRRRGDGAHEHASVSRTPRLPAVESPGQRSHFRRPHANSGQGPQAHPRPEERRVPRRQGRGHEARELPFRPLGSSLVDADGRLRVPTFEREAEEQTYDIFGPDGIY